MTLDEFKKDLENEARNAMERANKARELGCDTALHQAVGEASVFRWVRDRLEEVTT